MKILRLWRLARYLQHKADEGCELIAVPRWLAPKLHKLIWERRMERAAAKWADRVADISVAEWQAAMRERGEQQS